MLQGPCKDKEWQEKNKREEVTCKVLYKFTVYYNPDIIDSTSPSLVWSGQWLHILDTIIVWVGIFTLLWDSLYPQ